MFRRVFFERRFKCPLMHIKETSKCTLVGVFVLASSVLLAQKWLPSDARATKETINLYRSLKRISVKGFLFGHQDDLAYGVNWKYEPGRSDIYDVVNDYPAVFGWELGRIEMDKPVNLDSVPFDKMRGFIEQEYNKGAVITISWHLNNPLTGSPHGNLRQVL
jgi:mannan endo-1,4-beta-mannosidase